jgi:hypothetical protein
MRSTAPDRPTVHADVPVSVTLLQMNAVHRPRRYLTATYRGYRRIVMGRRTDGAMPRYRHIVMGRCTDAAVHRVLRGSRSSQRPLHRDDLRPSVIYRRQLAAFSRRDAVVRALGHGLGDGMPARGELGPCRACVDAVTTTIEAHARTTNDVPVNDASVNERIVDDRSVDVDDGRIVVESAARPEAADEAGSEVAEPIVNSTVESD